MIDEAIKNKETKISVIGLGYVGLPLAVAFAKVADVIGFDISAEKIAQYRKGTDVTGEVGDQAIRDIAILFTSDEALLKDCRFHIVAVPTPVHKDKSPDLGPLIRACKLLGRNMVDGSIVVFESTVYPGVTEEICIPLLEEASGLKCGEDFKVGYSPERINPGDPVHRLDTIVKVVSGMDAESLEAIANVYGMVAKAGIYRAENIRTAEAAKVIENAQRDINIAFMNELSMIFNLMKIDTKAVLEAAATKWNFLKFSPGLVGGHCIGVDPFYLTYKAEALGYHSRVILSGREINDNMGKYIAENTIKHMIQVNKMINGSKAAVFGVTFKENCRDVRNSKAVDVIRALEQYGVNVSVVDPIADSSSLMKEYGIQLCPLHEIREMDCILFTVAHDAFKCMKLMDIKNMFRPTSEGMGESPVLVDAKGIFSRTEAEALNFLYWRL